MEQPLAVNFLELATGHMPKKAFFDSLHFYDGYKVNTVVCLFISINFVTRQFFAQVTIDKLAFVRVW